MKICRCRKTFSDHRALYDLYLKASIEIYVVTTVLHISLLRILLWKGEQYDENSEQINIDS